MLPFTTFSERPKEAVCWVEVKSSEAWEVLSPENIINGYQELSVSVYQALSITGTMHMMPFPAKKASEHLNTLSVHGPIITGLT